MPSGTRLGWFRLLHFRGPFVAIQHFPHTPRTREDKAYAQRTIGQQTSTQCAPRLREGGSCVQVTSAGTLFSL